MGWVDGLVLPIVRLAPEERGRVQASEPDHLRSRHRLEQRDAADRAATAEQRDRGRA